MSWQSDNHMHFSYLGYLMWSSNCILADTIWSMVLLHVSVEKSCFIVIGCTFWSSIRFSLSVLWLSAWDVLHWKAAPRPGGILFSDTHHPIHFRLLLVVQYRGVEFITISAVFVPGRCRFEKLKEYFHLCLQASMPCGPLPDFCYSLLIGLPSFTVNYGVFGLFSLVLKLLPVVRGSVSIKGRALFTCFTTTPRVWEEHMGPFPCTTCILQGPGSVSHPAHPTGSQQQNRKMRKKAARMFW